MVKEKPIIFSAEMVKAILEGRKTMTRRVIKPQPIQTTNEFTEDGIRIGRLNLLPKCPYAQVGDRLWVRETWATENRFNRLKPSEIPQTARIFYLADGYSPFEMGKVRSPIFMPRWASRIDLEITEVRVERVQEIHTGDCKAEGIRKFNMGVDFTFSLEYKLCHEEFARLWDSLNAKRGYEWDTNPWVWVINFRISDRCPQ